MSKKIPLGIYVHVPFCGSVCDFCAFYQEKPHRKDLERYLEGVKREIELFHPKELPDTCFWGGGTPGLLPAKDIAFLGSEFAKVWGEAPKEWTVEMAPATVKKDKLLVMKDLGVTRISMGVQSFNEKLLSSLGRLHSPKQVYKAYDMIREAEFDNVNLDLIFAIPGQELFDWEDDMQEAARLDPEHLSTYCLTFEEDTALYVKLSEGKVKIDQEKEIQMYRRTWECLEELGYQQYEVSNFSKPGYECLHNINTWRMHDWIGFGPSAASQYKFKRYTNPSNLGEWADGLKAGEVKYLDIVDLDNEELFKDSLVFGLRMNEGVDVEELRRKYSQEEIQKVEQYLLILVGSGYLISANDRLKLTSEGRMIVDRIGSEILEIDL